MTHAMHNILALTFAIMTGGHACGASERMSAGLAEHVKQTKNVAETEVVDLRINIAPNNEDALAKSIAAGKVLSPKQYADKHGPTPQQLRDVMAHLEAHGMRAQHRGGHVIAVQASAGQVTAAMQTQLSTFKNAAGKQMRTKDKLPSWPKDLPAVVITGLSTRPDKVMHTRVKSSRHHDMRAFAAPHADGPLHAATIRSAYNMPTTAIGRGQTVAMIELDGYVPKDLDIYAHNMGIRRVPTHNILLPGATGKVVDEAARGEVTLDIQLAMAMAPGLDAIVVYEAPNSDHGLNDIYNRLANPVGNEPLVRSISCSWGEPESYMTQAQAMAANILLQQLAAQGQTVFAASGDSGALDDGKTRGVDDPAAQPYALGVGGTKLSTVNGVWASETTWTHGGGGVSRFWPSPVWQKDMEKRPTHASLTKRDVPDVALNADPDTGYLVYVGGWQQVGGTSCAAPIWAAFMAVSNAHRSAAGKPPLGFFAPIIYDIGASASGVMALHDVADHSTNGYYPAVLGLDAATGWGSINGRPLLDALLAR